MLRTAVLNQTVFDNLEALLPALREAVLYLAATLPKKTISSRGKAWTKFLKSSDYGQLPFVRMWSMELLRLRPEMTTFTTAIALADKFSDSLGVRAAAQIAERSRKMDWVREHKELWTNHSPADRRAIIYAGSALPDTERKIWLETIVKSTNDLLERTIAQHVKAK